MLCHITLSLRKGSDINVYRHTWHFYLQKSRCSTVCTFSWLSNLSVTWIFDYSLLHDTRLLTTKVTMYITHNVIDYNSLISEKYSNALKLYRHFSTTLSNSKDIAGMRLRSQGRLRIRLSKRSVDIKKGPKTHLESGKCQQKHIETSVHNHQFV